MRPEVIPLSPLRNRFITFFAARRSNQGLVHHLAGLQQLFIRPALDQVPIGHAARVGGLVGGGVYLAKAAACAMAAPDRDLLSVFGRHHAT